jgi:hypothetical protein
MEDYPTHFCFYNLGGASYMSIHVIIKRQLYATVLRCDSVNDICKIHEWVKSIAACDCDKEKNDDTIGPVHIDRALPTSREYDGPYNGCDSVHNPTLTKEMLDRELDAIVASRY